MKGFKGRSGRRMHGPHSRPGGGFRRRPSYGAADTNNAHKRGSRSRSGRGLYRSRNGAIAGVCRGLADYYGFSVFWLRMIVVLFLLFSGFWPVLFVYFLASLVMTPEPVRPIQTEDEQDFYDSYVHSRPNAARRLKRRFESLDRRLQRMEDTVTGREFEWDEKMNG